ncbi:MAG: DctP family TRAP transporter solute-binding subunit [Planctomycetes bacterium]|nr:DctP family TRAP transporter solute-binding subunit [Planctomycetota bacterium]
MRRIILAVLMCLLIASCSREPGAIKLSLILDRNSDWYRGAAKWKELVEARSGGRLRVRIIENASLSNNNQRAELEMVQSGALDASLESTILLSILDERYTVFSMPWLFKDHDAAERVCDGPLGKKMLDALEERGIVGLAYGVNGFRQITNNRRPIVKLKDLKNLKIRVPSIEMYISLFRRLGADPSQMNFGELFQALKQGTMHAQENPLSVIWAKKLYEVQNHITVWNYSYDPIILCFNKAKWESYPPDLQKIMKDAAAEAMNHERQLVRQADKDLLPKLEEKGMQAVVLSPEQLKPFKDASKKIYNDYRKRIGGERLDAFVKAAGE